ncbi:MAG: hypothetical protein ACXWL8_03480, partial [Candidatus Limnocylindria bacterium]
MTAPTRSGADRRIAVLSAELAAHLPPTSARPLRVPAAARAAHLAARRSGLAELEPLVVAVRNDEEAHRLADDLAAWLPAGMVRVLSERAALPLERALPEHDESGDRLEVLDLLGGRHHQLVVVAPLLALVQRTLSPAQLASARMSLRVGERIDQRALLGALVAGGYEAVVEVSGVGEFANRGGIVDLWPPGASDPLRLELFGDEVESMRAFDPMTQGSRRRMERAVLLPASEFLPAGGWQTLADRAPGLPSEALQADLAHLEQGDLAQAAETWAALLTAGPSTDHVPPNAHVVLTDPAELRAIAADLDLQATERRAGLVAAGELPDSWPLPYDAAAALSALEGRASEVLDEGGTDAGYATAPSLPGRADSIGPWLVELSAGRR